MLIKRSLQTELLGNANALQTAEDRAKEDKIALANQNQQLGAAEARLVSLRESYQAKLDRVETEASQLHAEVKVCREEIKVCNLYD